MKRTRFLAVLSAVGLVGCEPAPAPPRVAVAGTVNREAMRELEAMKPMPERDSRIDMRVNQRVREEPGENFPPTQPWKPLREVEPDKPADPGARVERDFVDAYAQVGRPRIVVLVNRGFGGKLIPDEHAAPAARDVTPLKPGEVDEAAAKAIDLAGLENMLADRLSCGKRVTVTGPAAAREKLTDAQVKDLESGRPEALAAVDSSLNGDILVQAQFIPTKQTKDGLEGRLQVEVINVRGAQVIGSAIADVDRSADKSQLDGAATYVTRKLMIDMLRAWTAPENAPPVPAK